MITKKKYDGFNPNSPEAYIVFSLNQSAFIDQSLELASKVENEFKADKRSSRGVKQAGFLVLWKTVMPSTLIETGFLTNRNEEKYLSSESGQQETAQSIFDALNRYKIKMEGEVNSLFNHEDRTLTGTTDTIPTIEKTQVKVKPVSVKADSIHQPVPINTTPIEANVTTYRIQIAASNKLIDPKLSPYNKLTKSFCEKDETSIYRLFAGSYESLDEAKAAQQEVKLKGFKDAFIVLYQNGKRTTKSIF